MVELVVRKNGSHDILSRFSNVVGEYKSVELDDKVVFNVPVDWSGFKDGTMVSLLKEFGEKLYVALAYFSPDDEIVTDAEGNILDGYYVVMNERKVLKYVKKKLRVIRIIDDSRNMFEVVSYVLDMQTSPPVIKVLELYSGGDDSGIKLSHFIKGDRL